MKRIAIAVGLIAGIALLSAATVGSVAGAQADAETNASLGAEVSSFMQASSTQAEAEVDDGLFAARLNRTNDPEERRALIEQRQAELAERQQRLEERRDQLDESGPIARYAVATEVAVGAAELEASANRTERIARAGDVNATALAEIRADASELQGQAVAEIAGGIGAPVGPPDDVPAAGDGSEDAPGRQGGEKSRNDSDDSGDADNGSDTDGPEGGENGSEGNEGPPEDSPGNDADSAPDDEEDEDEDEAEADDGSPPENGSGNGSS